LKIKCFRFECSECGELGSIQVFYRKDGSIGYARARHKNKQRFHYHKQSIEYVKEKLGEWSKLDQGQSTTTKVIDPELLSSSQNLGFEAGPMGNLKPEECFCWKNPLFFSLVSLLELNCSNILLEFGTWGSNSWVWPSLLEQ